MHLLRKRIAGKAYLYAVRSVRTPDGKIHKLVKLLRSAGEARRPEVEEELRKKEAELRTRYAVAHYAKDKVFNEEAFRALEEARAKYRKVLGALTPEQRRDMFDRFTVNFTYESNAIEGNSLTLKDVAIVLHENLVIPGKELREIYETRNTRPVVEHILQKKFKVREPDALRMHRMLVRDIGIPPGYKRVPNYVLGRELLTTPPEETPGEMRGLFAWYEKNRGRMHPLQLAAHFHGRFEGIHPFQDGNGRVGRFLINTELVNNGYPPLIIRKTRRIAYLNALTDFDNGYPATLERFLLDRYRETFAKFFEVYVRYARPVVSGMKSF